MFEVVRGCCAFERIILKGLPYEPRFSKTLKSEADFVMSELISLAADIALSRDDTYEISLFSDLFSYSGSFSLFCLLSFGYFSASLFSILSSLINLSGGGLNLVCLVFFGYLFCLAARFKASVLKSRSEDDRIYILAFIAF
jgi:hypothetical protein